jgi:hypothetical protein
MGGGSSPLSLRGRRVFVAGGRLVERGVVAFLGRGLLALLEGSLLAFLERTFFARTAALVPRDAAFLLGGGLPGLRPFTLSFPVGIWHGSTLQADADPGRRLGAGLRDRGRKAKGSIVPTDQDPSGSPPSLAR